jgi:hypothetical protein
MMVQNPPPLNAPRRRAARSGGTTEKTSMIRMIHPVDATPVEARQGSERQADQHRTDGGREPDQERDSRAVDDAGEEVAPEVVDPKPELPLRRS